MFNRHKLENVLFIVFLALILSSQARAEDRKDGRSNEHASGAVHNQPRQQTRMTERTQSIHSSPVGRREVQTYQNRSSRPQQRASYNQDMPRVYATPENRTVESNGFFHHRHNGNWHPSYNFYDNQYHFYPYVTVASMVTLSSAAVPVFYNGITYYYDQNSFYQFGGDAQAYWAVPPPIGIIVNTIYTTEHQHIINGVVYYSHNGIYYQPVSGGYQVVQVVRA